MSPPKKNKKRKLLVLSLTLLTAFFAFGCRTRREIVLQETDAANLAFDLRRLPEDLQLNGVEESSFVLWNRTTHQSHHVLQLAPDTRLGKRFHRRHDLTLFCVSGRAIAEVEDERHFLEPGAAVFVPRMHNFTIVPHQSPGAVTLLMVYSPPFDGSNVLVLE